MQIGCSAPTSGPLIGPDSLVRIATEAEALGFDYVTVSDHVIIPTSIASRYPYSESGEFPSGAAAPRLEQLTAALKVHLEQLTDKLEPHPQELNRWLSTFAVVSNSCSSSFCRLFSLLGICTRTST